MLLPFCHVTLRGQKPLPPGWPRELATLGDHLRRRRLELGLLQREVARILGVHANAVSTWEQNQKKPFARQVVRVLDFLGYCPWSPVATFGERLRRAREAQGLGQRELADLLGTSQEVLRSWEKGRYKPSRRFRDRVRGVLGLTV